MKAHRIGSAVWILLAAVLYFFENNTGTRCILLCSLLVLLMPALRGMFLSADERSAEEVPESLSILSFTQIEADEPGDVRPYAAGDPIRRIHWKLSAKKDEPLVREAEAGFEISEATARTTVSEERTPERTLRRYGWIPLFVMLVCVGAVLVLPTANRSAQALCNRVFAASEAVNAYAYDFFPVAESQSTVPAACLLGLSTLSLIVLTLLLRSRALMLALMAACALVQVYFGLAFPAAVNVLLFGTAGGWMIRKPLDRKNLLRYVSAVLLVSGLTALLYPGVDAATEAASETARDALSRLVQPLTGGISELPEGEIETRHAHTLALQTGENEAETDREYRQVTVEEEQISMPHWISWLKVALLFLLLLAVVVLPFAPFLLLNARKKKAAETRRLFASENVSEAVCAIFQQVMLWFCETGYDVGNHLYRDWAEKLPPVLPENYALCFTRCAEDYEEALYSCHTLPEAKRQDALALLQATERALFKTASRRQRFRIKYWMCLCE